MPHRLQPAAQVPGVLALPQKKREEMLMVRVVFYGFIWFYNGFIGFIMVIFWFYKFFGFRTVQTVVNMVV